MTAYDYDIVIIGGGSGGFTSSALAKGLGKKILIIEKNKLGGECTWSGCVPSKALLKASETVQNLRTAQKFGIEINNIPEKFDGALEYTRNIIQKVYSGETPEIVKEHGIDVKFGDGEFLDSHTFILNGEKIRSRHFIISTGSSPKIIHFNGLENIDYLTNENIFELEKIPESLAVIGAGPIGIEMAQAFRRLGSEVTVIMKHDRILMNDDEEAAMAVMESLAEEGIKFIKADEISELKKENNNILIKIKTQNNTESVAAEKLMLSVGRVPNTKGLSLEKAGVEYSEKGIHVDNTMKTTTPNIYACGDVTGKYQFSHMAEYEAKIAVLNTVLPIKKKADYSSVPWCTFTDPELAHTGMTEEEAKEKHSGNIRVYKHNFKDTDRGKTDSVKSGFCKVICNKKGFILGAQVVGARAGEIIHGIQYLKTLKIPFYKAYTATHIYPTYYDAVKHTAKMCFLDRVSNNFFVKLIKIFKGDK